MWRQCGTPGVEEKRTAGREVTVATFLIATIDISSSMGWIGHSDEDLTHPPTDKDTVQCLCCKWPLKTLWKMEHLLIMSKCSIVHSDFKTNNTLASFHKIFFQFIRCLYFGKSKTAYWLKGYIRCKFSSYGERLAAGDRMCPTRILFQKLVHLRHFTSIVFNVNVC